MAPKSILKEPSDMVTSQSPTATKSRDERNREIALYHANLIQAQKDIEAGILEALETFIDFPTDPSTTPANPTLTDTSAFQKLIHPFTPSDYDDLVDERRLAGKCGYVFCSKALNITGGGGRFKIFGKKSGQEFKVVARAKVECWCSADCARRAMFVKVQLIEEPAWERRSNSTHEIEILARDTEADASLEPTGNSASRDRGKLDRAMRNMIIERGDESKPARSVNMIMETLVERHTVQPPIAPNKEESQWTSHEAIEGYAPKTKSSKEAKQQLGDKNWDLQMI